MADHALRLPALLGLEPAPHPDRLDLRDGGKAVRVIFRGSRAAAEAAGAAFGVVLPTAPCRANSSGDRHALWLGPDEWLLIGPDGDPATLTAALGAAIGSEPHGLIDVGHRTAAIVIGGCLVTEVLNAGCPLDLDMAVFPVGMCTRTLLGKADILLWRVEPLSFRLEASRSHLPYVVAFLREAAA